MGGGSTPIPTSIPTSIPTIIPTSLPVTSANGGFDITIIFIIIGAGLLLLAAWFAFSGRQRSQLARSTAGVVSPSTGDRIFCTSCGAANLAAAKFCTQCGAALVAPGRGKQG